MPNFLCSSSITRCLRLYRTTAALLSPSSTFIFSPLSSRSHHDAEHNTQTLLNPISEFLLNECGLCPSQLTNVMRSRARLSRVRSSQTARRAVEVLRESGFTPNQIIKTILGYPTSLELKADGRLKPKIEFLKTLGINGQDIGNVICKCPRLLGYSLENKFAPKIPYLEKLFGSKPNLGKAIKNAPFLLICKGTENLEKKVKRLTSLGLIEEEIHDLIKKCPSLFTLSINKIQDNMDFLTHAAGFPPNIVVTYPRMLNYRIEERLKPRFEVFKALCSMQKSKTRLSLVNMFSISEQNFIQKFIECSPHSSILKKIYKCKGNPADGTNLSSIFVLEGKGKPSTTITSIRGVVSHSSFIETLDASPKDYTIVELFVPRK